MNFHRKFKLCTLCLDDKCNLSDIFEHNERDFILSVAIQELFQFKLTEGGLVPWMICTKCIKKVRDFVTFRNHATKCMKILQFMLFDRAKYKNKSLENGVPLEEEAREEHVNDGSAEGSPLVESSQSVTVSVGGGSGNGSDSGDSHSVDRKCSHRRRRVRVVRSQLSCHVPITRCRQRNLCNASTSGERIGPSSKPENCQTMGSNQVNNDRVQVVEREKKRGRPRIRGVAVLETPKKRLRSNSAAPDNSTRESTVPPTTSRQSTNSLRRTLSRQPVSNLVPRITLKLISPNRSRSTTSTVSRHSSRPTKAPRRLDL